MDDNEKKEMQEHVHSSSELLEIYKNAIIKLLPKYFNSFDELISTTIGPVVNYEYYDAKKYYTEHASPLISEEISMIIYGAHFGNESYTDIKKKLKNEEYTAMIKEVASGMVEILMDLLPLPFYEEYIVDKYIDTNEYVECISKYQTDFLADMDIFKKILEQLDELDPHSGSDSNSDFSDHMDHMEIDQNREFS